MISKLTGKIARIDQKYIVLDVNGVGYKVFMTPAQGKANETANVWTYLAVRENSLDLYGFPTLEELNFFELLITISGIGPKTAMGILSLASVESIKTAVQTEDTSHITKVSGIGKKVAEKIVRELKDKVDEVSHTAESKLSMRGDADVIEALKALGYKESEAREAVKKLPKGLVKTNEKVKEALKVLGR
ncbi:MAG TPA: Holliday junction branch migration protein RuvA [Candidatus Paceibacterota bacterium]